jgi:hypothetical protein
MRSVISVWYISDWGLCLLFMNTTHDYPGLSYLILDPFFLVACIITYPTFILMDRVLMSYTFL